MSERGGRSVNNDPLACTPDYERLYQKGRINNETKLVWNCGDRSFDTDHLAATSTGYGRLPEVLLTYGETLGKAKMHEQACPLRKTLRLLH